MTPSTALQTLQLLSETIENCTDAIPQCSIELVAMIGLTGGHMQSHILMKIEHLCIGIGL